MFDFRHIHPYQMKFQGEAYALPCDIIYYIEGANPKLDAFVREHLPDIDDVLAQYDLRFLPVALTSDTLLQYLSVRPDVRLLLPQHIQSPASAISGKLLCRLSQEAENEEYPFLACDVTSCRRGRFMDVLQDFAQTLCPSVPDRLATPMADEELEADEESCYEEAAPCFGAARPMPEHQSKGRGAFTAKSLFRLEHKEAIDVRQQFIDELRQRLQNLSDEGVNIFLQTLGNDFLKSIKDLSPKPLSPLVIDEHYRILLPDYDLEIKMNALWRAIYILFIRHEEGIILKDLWSFRDELASIYKRIASGEYERMEATIDDVTTPGSDNFRQYLSKINKAFNQVLAVDLAQHYIISGARGEAYSIRLPRDKFSLCPKLAELP